MEHYIINVTDITYLSELTHTPSQQKRMAMDFWVWGLIRRRFAITYVATH